MEVHKNPTSHIANMFDGDKAVSIAVFVEVGGKPYKIDIQNETELIFNKVISKVYYDESKKNQNIAKILNAFGSRLIYVEEIPNEYSNSPYMVNNPWLVVTTQIGPIKVGRRSHVWSINWDKTKQDKTAEELFPKEDVTKFNRTIHAWTQEKLKEYISKILE